MIIGFQAIANFNDSILLLVESSEFSDKLLREIVGHDNKGVKTLREGHTILVYEQVKKPALAFNMPVYRVTNGSRNCFYSKLAAEELSKNVYRVDSTNVSWIKLNLRPTT